MIDISIDGKTISCREGQTVLAAARENGIDIPNLCYHPALKPSGACKLCGVEVSSPTGKQAVMLSCILKVKEGLVVKTDTPQVLDRREKAFRKLYQMAPDAERIRILGEKWGFTPPPEPDGCIRCRLCVRVCNDIVKARALKMEKTETGQQVARGEGPCIGCGTCANLCPTHAISVEDQGNVRTIAIKGRVLSQLPLERCDACGRMYATADFLAHVSHVNHEHHHPDTKNHPHLCPSCAKLMCNRATTEKEHIKK
ncbi:MAG: 2Fe-2S iron-sulfur cluster-binding protein [Desulfobacterales bacterium]|nr:2Fe-2S iron-sulfur cluster-binding protein [Desulfobacterales bacterium]